jgi:hypothetical protein
MGVSPVSDPTVTFPTPPPKTIIINVSASVQAPTYFLRIFNINSLTVTASGEATRRNVNIMLVIDRSGSLYQSGSCGALQSAAATFVNSFINGSDRLGMLTFGTDYNVDFAPNINFGSASPSLQTKVGQLYCYGYTNAAAAYWAAYQQLVTLNDQGALNVMLFFTDGMPNTLTFGVASDGTDNRMPVKTLTTPYSNNSLGYDIRNKSSCLDSAGRNNTSGLWNPGPFTGVISFAGGLYKPTTTTFPITQSADAQKIDSTGGDYGGCIFDAQFNNAGTIYTGGSPSRAIAGPGFPAILDVAYLPEEDINRNKTGTGYGGGGALASVNRYPNTFPAAYQGKIRVDDILTGSGSLGLSDTITNAGINALDYAAQRSRDDSISKSLNVVTYTIGLGNAPGGVNDTLLQRIANDPNANNYDSTKPVGEYVFAPNAAQLNQAFSKIASDVLRLSK